MGLDHKERYYVSYDEVDKVWDIYRDVGMFFPYYISSCDDPETAGFIRDALESFPKEVDDYIRTWVRNDV